MPPKKKEEPKTFTAQEEEAFSESSTIDDESNVPEEFPYDFFKPSFKPHKHQKQSVYLCLSAEQNRAKTTRIMDAYGNEEGVAEYFCNVGCIANGTGTGKSATMAALACYPIEERPDISTYSSALLTLDYKPNAEKPVLPFSVMVLKKENAAKIISDCQSYMMEGIIQTSTSKSDLSSRISSMSIRNIDKSKPYYAKLNYLNKKLFELDDNLKVIEESEEFLNLKSKADSMGIKLSEYNRLYPNQVITNYYNQVKKYRKIEDEIPKEEEKLREKEISIKTIEFFSYIMSDRRLFICTNENFHLLFPLFEFCRVERLILDEPQEIVITNQEKYRDSTFHEITHLFNSPDTAGMIRDPFLENSPAVMVWLMSATIHNIFFNETKSGSATKRYFISWVSRNAPFLRDYHNSTTGNYRTPELTKTHIIKFSKSYTDKVLGMENFVEKKYIKTKRNIYWALTKDILPQEKNDKLLKYLENEDFSGMLSFLEVSNLDQVVEGITRIIDGHTNDLQNKLNMTKLQGKALENYFQEIQNAVNENDRNIALLNQRYKCLFEKEKFKCGICNKDADIKEYDYENYEKASWLDNNGVCFCQNCCDVVHFSCWDSLKNAQECSNCATLNSQNRPCLMFKSENERIIEDTLVEQLERKSENEILNIFESKLVALKHLLSRKTGNKVLLYVNFLGTNDSKHVAEIVKSAIKRDYSIILMTPYTKKELELKFGDGSSNMITCVKTQNDTSKEIEKFRTSSGRTIWIADTSKSTGMDFEFVTDLISYSIFPEISQIIGRVTRPQRTETCNVYILTTDHNV